MRRWWREKNEKYDILGTGYDNIREQLNFNLHKLYFVEKYSLRTNAMKVEGE